MNGSFLVSTDQLNGEEALIAATVLLNGIVLDIGYSNFTIHSEKGMLICFDFCPPLSLKVGDTNCHSICEFVSLSVILAECNTIVSCRQYLKKPLSFSNELLYLNTLWPTEDPLLILRSKGQGHRYLHSLSVALLFPCNLLKSLLAFAMKLDIMHPNGLVKTPMDFEIKR